MSPVNTGIITNLIHEFENMSLAQQFSTVLSPEKAATAVNGSNQQHRPLLLALLSMVLSLTFTCYSCLLCSVYGLGSVSNHGRLVAADG